MCVGRTREILRVLKGAQDDASSFSGVLLSRKAGKKRVEIGRAAALVML